MREDLFWTVWAAAFVLWLVFRTFVRRRMMQQVPGAGSETYAGAGRVISVLTTAVLCFSLVTAVSLPIESFASKAAVAALLIFAGIRGTALYAAKIWRCPVCGAALPMKAGIFGIVLLPAEKCPSCGKKIP